MPMISMMGLQDIGFQTLTVLKATFGTFLTGGQIQSKRGPLFLNPSKLGTKLSNLNYGFL